MKLKKVINLLKGEVHNFHNDQYDLEISTVEACDLMSDILISVHVPDMLLTELTNTQVIRTASVAGIKAVVVVKGKPIDPKMVMLADEEGITIVTTPYDLLESSVLLFENGIKSASC